MQRACYRKSLHNRTVVMEIVAKPGLVKSEAWRLKSFCATIRTGSILLSLSYFPLKSVLISHPVVILMLQCVVCLQDAI